MTCRCRTQEEHAQRAVEQAEYSVQATQRDLSAKATKTQQAAEARIAELQERSPNPDQFAIDDIDQVGKHLVVKVEYPGCIKCSYDRRKVMVFLDVTIKEAIKWRRIDPHFREPPARHVMVIHGLQHAPSPAARFPASPRGWQDAIAYARSQQ